MSIRNLFAVTALLIVGASFTACSKSADKAATASSSSESQVAVEGHTHGGWWCDEHGMPEEVCAQCDSKLAADLKAKGDWCEKHNRPDSQCFICHPEKEAEFAAIYEAKYGEKPPKPTDIGDEHQDEHKEEQK